MTDSERDALRAELERVRGERDAARELIEGKFDHYDINGDAVLPRGWVIVDGGRLDELEKAEAERDAAESWVEALGDALVPFAQLAGRFDHATDAMLDNEVCGLTIRHLRRARAALVPSTLGEHPAKERTE